VGKRVPIFISLDPEREGLAAIEDYLQAFGPRFIGLTGERDDVLQIRDQDRATLE
jgi:protein SCO1/2